MVVMSLYRLFSGRLLAGNFDLFFQVSSAINLCSTLVCHVLQKIAKLFKGFSISMICKKRRAVNLFID